jgi:hypothetical protein
MIFSISASQVAGIIAVVSIFWSKSIQKYLIFTCILFYKYFETCYNLVFSSHLKKDQFSYSLDLKHFWKAHVSKTCSPVCSTFGRKWNLTFQWVLKEYLTVLWDIFKLRSKQHEGSRHKMFGGRIFQKSRVLEQSPQQRNRLSVLESQDKERRNVSVRNKTGNGIIWS